MLDFSNRQGRAFQLVYLLVDENGNIARLKLEALRRDGIRTSCREWKFETAQERIVRFGKLRNFYVNDLERLEIAKPVGDDLYQFILVKVNRLPRAVPKITYPDLQLPRPQKRTLGEAERNVAKKIMVNCTIF